MVPENCEIPGCAVLAATATAAPSAAKRLAISAPMPRLAPVTMATRPSSRPMQDLPASGHQAVAAFTPSREAPGYLISSQSGGIRKPQRTRAETATAERPPLCAVAADNFATL